MAFRLFKTWHLLPFFYPLLVSSAEDQQGYTSGLYVVPGNEEGWQQEKKAL